MALYRLADLLPTLGEGIWVAPTAVVIGDVRLASEASVWWNAVLRGDNDPITIGAQSNIQDSAVLHTDLGAPLNIGQRVTVGHQAMLHGCTIGDGSLIGMGAIVLNDARIGSGCLIGAGSLITEGKIIPDRSLVVGQPGKVLRELSDEEIARLSASALHYLAQARRYAEQLVQIGSQISVS